MVPLTEDFLCAAGKLTVGDKKPVLWEISMVKLNPVGLNRRITLVVVNWSLHLVSENYALAPGWRGKIEQRG